MEKDMYTQEELLQKTGVAEEVLTDWMNAKLIRPAGFADDQTPLFTADGLERLVHIRRLLDCGYGSEEIQKIIKKVGLPKARSGQKAAAKKHLYLTVGNLAERSGVSPRTIKHWEEKGIIEPNMRTEGGFRLYSESFVFLCQLIRDLQLFGYTLEEIKSISDEVRGFLAVQSNIEAFPKAGAEKKLAAMTSYIQVLFEKIRLLKEGVERWEDILKKIKKDVLALRNKNQKRPEPDHASKKGKADV